MAAEQPTSGQAQTFDRRVLRWTLWLTLLFEAITLALRFGTGVSAQEFNRTAPLLLQIHHMFWSLPIFCVAALVYRWRSLMGFLIAAGIACITSDLAHHFIVLPLTVGNTGWHWP